MERRCRSGAFSARPFAMGRRFVMRLSVEKRWLPEIVEEPSGFLSDCGIERLAGVAVPKRRTCRSRNRTELHEKYGQTFYWLFPLDGYSFAAPSFQLHPVFGAASSRVPPGDTMSRFVGFGDKSWDNSKNFFQTQGFEFLFLSQRARRDAFASSISPKTPVLKLNRPFARKPPATIASESTRAAFMLVEKPQVAALRRPRVK